MKVRCIEKNRNAKGAIVNYTLQDERGQVIKATAQQIKAEMQSNKYQFINLQLDKAGRLVDKAVNNTKPSINKTKPASNEQKERLKNQIKDFIKRITKDYTKLDDFKLRLSKDYMELSDYGIDIDDDSKTYRNWYILGEALKNETKEVQTYFKKLMNDIQKQARKSSVELGYVGSEGLQPEEFMGHCKLPESVINFQKATGCSGIFIEALVNLAARETNDIAIFALTDDRYIDPFCIFSTIMFASKYDVAAEYFEQAIEEQRYISLDCFDEGTEEYNETKNSITMGLSVHGNKLGKDFYAKFIDFSYKRFIKNNKITIDICKKKINEKIQAYINYEKKYGKGKTDFHFMGYSYVSNTSVRETMINKILDRPYEENIYLEHYSQYDKGQFESSHPEEFKAMNAFEKDGIDYIKIYYILKFGKYKPYHIFGASIYYDELTNDELKELIKDILN